MEDATKCRQIANQLLEKHGVYLQPINYPTVPVGEECLRIIITARHLPKHINHLAYSLKRFCMETIKLIGRSSRLSLLQIDIVKRKIQSAFPDMKVEVIARSSKGDALQNIPLHTVEGSDFFTQDIFDALAIGEADIAVHSLKDMSSEHFLVQNKFAVVDRDDTRDVAIFNSDIEEKIKRGETIIIGTCSPRRGRNGD